MDYAAGVREVKAAWAAAGRSGAPQFNVFGMPPKQAAAEHMIETGFERLIFGLPSASAEQVLPLLDRYARLAEALG